MIGSFDIEMLTPPCDPGSARLVAKARFAADITPVLPYLNATLSGASYLPEADSLIWEDDGHTIAFHPHEMAVSEVQDRDAAELLVGDLVDLVNRTWEQREGIVPSVATRHRPTPMAVYKLLPGTNCKECHEAGCWHFALKLVAGAVNTGECPPLTQPEFAAQLAELRGLVAEIA
jgi:ArsR family metal-binding transcriptional regulator